MKLNNSQDGEPMKDQATRERFIELLAKGYSYEKKVGDASGRAGQAGDRRIIIPGKTADRNPSPVGDRSL